MSGLVSKAPLSWGEGAPRGWAARLDGKEGTIRAFLVAAALASAQPDRAKEAQLWRVVLNGKPMWRWAMEAIEGRVAELERFEQEDAAAAALYDLTWDDVRAMVADNRAELGDRMASDIHVQAGFLVLRFKWAHGPWLAFEARQPFPNMFREWPEDRDWPAFPDDVLATEPLEGTGRTLCYFHQTELKGCGCFAMIDVLTPAREVLGEDLPENPLPGNTPLDPVAKAAMEAHQPRPKGEPSPADEIAPRYEMHCQEASCGAHVVSGDPLEGCETCSSAAVLVHMAGDPKPPSVNYAFIIATNDPTRATTQDRPCAICGAAFGPDSVGVGCMRGQLLIAAHVECVVADAPKNRRVTMGPQQPGKPLACDACVKPFVPGQAFVILGDSAKGRAPLRVHAEREACGGAPPPAVAAELPKKKGGRKRKEPEAAPPQAAAS